MVDYPRCRIYRQFIQQRIGETDIWVGSHAGLFHYTELCCYANFRTSYKKAGIEQYAQSIERSYQMLKLVDSAIALLRAKHKHAETYYWILYYSFLSPQEHKNAEEIANLLRTHIADISYRTYYRRRKDAIEALFSILWGYTSKDISTMLESLLPT